MRRFLLDSILTDTNSWQIKIPLSALSLRDAYLSASAFSVTAARTTSGSARSV